MTGWMAGTRFVRGVTIWSSAMWDMPRMNGIEFVSQIKRHAELKSIPVIIVSYKDKEEDRLAGLQAGANYYLTKSSFQDDSFIEAAVNLIGEA